MRRQRQPDGFAAIVAPGDPPQVIVRGEIDIATAGEFESSVTRAAAAGAPVTIDLTETTFMDSTGLSVIVRLASMLADPPDPAMIILHGPQVAVRKTLMVSGLDRLVTIIDC